MDLTSYISFVYLLFIVLIDLSAFLSFIYIYVVLVCTTAMPFTVLQCGNKVIIIIINIYFVVSCMSFSYIQEPIIIVFEHILQHVRELTAPD